MAKGKEKVPFGLRLVEENIGTFQIDARMSDITEITAESK